MSKLKIYLFAFCACQIMAFQSLAQYSIAMQTNYSLCSEASWETDGKRVWNGLAHTKPHLREIVRRGLTCDVATSPSDFLAQLERETNPQTASDETICREANHKGQWRHKTGVFKEWVDEARKRGLFCGVTPAQLSDEVLCLNATKKRVHWELDLYWETANGWKPYVEEARRRGLTCSAVDPIFVRDVAPPKPKNTRPPQKFAEPQPQPKKAPQKTPESSEAVIVSASSGSGFAVSSTGHVVTNHHVINGCQKVFVHYNGQQIPTRLLAKDKTNDLAVLKAEFIPEQVFPLSTEKPQILQDIYVAGYPFGMEVSSSVKVTSGIISSLAGLQDNFSRIQIDAALQPGNSGGPIIDLKGNIVGVAVAKLDLKAVFEAFGVVPEGTNFGVKTSILGDMLDSLGIDKKAPNKENLPKSQIAKQIEQGTYYLSCWMTMAQIERLRTQKVIFENIK